MDKKYVADRITELRIKKNVSEYQMSLDLGKNKSYIQNISSGRSLPSMSQFYEICQYFNITPYQFFDEELHNLPLYQKACDLLKQLDEDDMMTIIPLLKRLSNKEKIRNLAGLPPGNPVFLDFLSYLDLFQLLTKIFQSPEFRHYYLYERTNN